MNSPEIVYDVLCAWRQSLNLFCDLLLIEETMRAKQMLATMSHEIRSPLSGVVSMTEILSTTKLDKEQRQLVNVMLSSGDLVLQLINDILDLSKVESGLTLISSYQIFVFGNIIIDLQT